MVAGYSEFWGGSNSYNQIERPMPTSGRMRRVVNKDGFRQYKALFDALLGATTGGTALATHARVSHMGNQNGSDLGNPRILTVTDINRATTAADVTALKALTVNVSERPTPYPRDLSGNGGPALS